MKLFKKDKLSQFNEVLEKDTVHSNIQNVLDKVTSQIEENEQVYDEITEFENRLTVIKGTLAERQKAYRKMQKQLEELAGV